MKRLRILCLLVVFFAVVLALQAGEEIGTGASVQRIAARMRSSVFFVMVYGEKTTEEKGEKKVQRVIVERGTSFLLSRTPPLAVTNAHIANKAKAPTDILVRTETGKTFAVRAFHLHKDYNPDSSGKKPYTTDLALLELESAPEEAKIPLTLAPYERCGDLRGVEVVTLGFPTHATVKDLERPEAVVRAGIIRRMVDYNSTTRSPLLKRPMLEHSVDVLPGESGSPLIERTSGKVVAVQHGTRRATKKVEKIDIPWYNIPVAIHVDQVWGLLEQTNFKKVVQAVK